MNYLMNHFKRLFLLSAILAALIISGCSAQSGRATVSPKPIGNEEIPNQEAKEEQAQNEEPRAEADPQPLRSVPILYYHSLGYEEGNELRVPPEKFASHMEYLAQNGYESVTLTELYQYFYEGGVLPEKAFVLTFDDGYEDNYTYAFPIAEKYGYSGTIFMVTEWIEGTGYLKREQLLAMSRAGWQIESHTVTHPYLNSISREQIKEELLTSQKVLEELLGKPQVALAYPYGVYDSLIIELSREAGYKMGLTTDKGWAGPEDPFRLRRVYCYARMSLDEFVRRVENADY